MVRPSVARSPAPFGSAAERRAGDLVHLVDPPALGGDCTARSQELSYPLTYSDRMIVAANPIARATR